MSLRDFVLKKDVAARLKPFRFPRNPKPQQIEVEPSGADVRITGTAFDYLMRFELRRLAPHATDGRWVAEYAEYWFPFEATPGKWTGPTLVNWRETDPVPDPFQMRARIMAVCHAARTDYASYIKDATTTPTRDAQRALAVHAVRLAKLDGFYRRTELDVTFEHAPPEQVEELVDLLAAVPVKNFLDENRMCLNPNFGKAANLVGGADADLIIGDTIVDIKTTKTCDVKDEYQDQLFGYFLLARRAGLPAVNNVALYFSRFGQMRKGPTAFWTEKPEFADTEKWFFERAAEVYPPPVIVVRVAAPAKARTVKAKSTKDRKKKGA